MLLKQFGKIRLATKSDFLRNLGNISRVLFQQLCRQL